MRRYRRQEMGETRGAGFLLRGALALATVFVGVSASTCVGPDYWLEECKATEDCGSLPGTVCIDTLCMCPVASDVFCRGACRPLDECTPSWDGAGGGGGAIKCTTAATCPQPGDGRCGTATCDNGVCGLDAKPFGKLASQVAGDCVSWWCDGDGNLIQEKDGSDRYDDGTVCTVDLCEEGMAKNEPYPDGYACLQMPSGACFEGACVGCVEGPFGPLGCEGEKFVCDDMWCVLSHCVNLAWDPGSGETSLDCGGPCRPCEPDKTCTVGADCLSGVCVGGICELPTCTDGVRNDKETGVDCGGPPSCPRCPADEGCKTGADCISSVCWAGTCQAPTCTDGIMNGDETAWDCGGSCAPCP